MLNMNAGIMIRSFAVGCAAALLLVACAKDENPVVKTPLTVPSSYDTTTFATNASEELAMNASLTALSDEMKKSRVANATITMDALTAKVGALRSLVTGTYGAEVDAILLELVKASGGAYDPMKAPGENSEGGVAGAFLFDEHGADLEQWVEKGLFGGMQFHQGTILLTGDVSQADIDGAIALFGAHASFRNSNDATKHAPNQDRYAAGYGARRDKNDGNGVYTKFRNAAIKAQAAIKAGADYNTERDEAAAAMRLNWEKAIVATAINYGFEVQTKLSATSPTTTDIASGAHSLGEMVGFLRGLRGVVGKVITDVQLETQLGFLKAPVTGSVAVYEHWQTPVTSLPAIQNVIKNLQSIYGFTDAEIEDFKTNWVASQKR